MYKLRVPVFSSIRNKPSPDVIFSVLQEINVSRPAHKRLPQELLLHIYNDLYSNSVYDQVHSAWTTIADEEQLADSDYILQYHPDVASMPRGPMLHVLRDPWQDFVRWHYAVGSVLDNVSAPDLLYRLRCFFPEIYVRSFSAAPEKVWHAYLQHKETGLGLEFLDWDGEAQLQIRWSRWRVDGKWHYLKPEGAGMAFPWDIIRLLNAFFETVDGKRLAYFHPAAIADLPTSCNHFPAVPRHLNEMRLGGVAVTIPVRLTERVLSMQKAWLHISGAVTDLVSYKSLLPIKYNIDTLQVDLTNGTADLTTIISSSLLFYRLLCYFPLRDHSKINIANPITSVWQVKLVHRQTKAAIIFMDDRGLFDIRADGKAEEVMQDIVALLNFLFASLRIVGA